MSLTVSVGGNPAEKSSGLATSMSTLPARFAAPTPVRAARVPEPLVAFTTTSPWAPAPGRSSSGTEGFGLEPGGHGSRRSVEVRAAVADTSLVPRHTS